MENMTSLEKALLLLKVLSKDPYSYKIADLSNLSGLNRTTAYRIITTLEKSKYVIKNDNTKEYKIGPAVFQMGSIYLNNFNFKDNILKILNEISYQTKESVGFAIREGNDIVSLYEIEINQPLKMNYKPGVYYPMNRGCYGKCLMAYHDQIIVKDLLYSQKFEKVCSNTLTEPEDILKEYGSIRKQGYVISDCEVSSYAIGVGIPVYNSAGEVKACAAVSFVKRYDNVSNVQKIDEIKEVLKAFSAEFTKYI